MGGKNSKKQVGLMEEKDIRPGYSFPPETMVEVLYGRHGHLPVLDLPDPPPSPAGPKTTLERIADALEAIAGAITGPEPDKSAPKAGTNNE